MIDVQQEMVNKLTYLKENNPQQLQDMLYQMRVSTKLYVETVHCDILTESLSDAEKLAFLNGELDREIYMPDYMVKMYDIYDDIFAGRKTDAAFVLYRGAAKSSIKVMATCKAIAFALEPSIVFISESKRQATLDNLRVQDIFENNKVLNLIFGNLKGNIWNQELSVFNNNGYTISLHATGMGSRIRGINYLGQRPSLVIPDDFESETNCNTISGRENVLNTINNKILKMGDYVYKIVFQGTIVHPDAFLSQIISGDISRFSGRKGAIVYQGISDTDSIRFDDVKKRWIADPPEMFKIGEPAWKSRYPYEYIKKEFTYQLQIGKGSKFWQILQEWWNIPRHDTSPVFETDKIVELKDAILKRFRNIHYLEVTREGKVKKIPVNLYEGFDPAIARNKVNDYTIDYILAVTPEGNRVIVEIFQGKIGAVEQVDRIIETNQRYYIQEACIETFAYQASLKEHVDDRARKLKIRVFTSDYNDTTNTKGGKYKLGLTHLVNRGGLSYLSTVDNIGMHKRELGNFDVKSINDDSCDGLFLAENAAKKYPNPQNYDVDEYIKSVRKMESRSYKDKRIYRKNKRSLIAI